MLPPRLLPRLLLLLPLASGEDIADCWGAADGCRPTPPPPSFDGGAPGAAACTSHDEYARQIDRVATNCCDQFDQENNCDNGVPEICDTRCAPVFIAFWTACQQYITQSLSSPFIREQFIGMHGKCTATLAANEVHDTDLVTPGDQHDYSTKLRASVSCHNQPLHTAGDLNDNSGPMDSIWMIGVSGDSSCMHAACPQCNGGYTTEQERKSCPAFVNKQTVQAALEREFGSCVEHRPKAGDAAETQSYIHPVTTTISTSGIADHTTYQLALKFAPGSTDSQVDNVYAIFGAPAVTAGDSAGEPAHVMTLPAAYQEPAPFGVNIGGTNPSFWAYSPTARFDSWLSVGVTDSKNKDSLSAIGIDFESWDEKTPLVIDNGAVFWMDPTHGVK